ncbi:hypothetical protein [Aggregatibacter segnis]|uniref:hypothetical protein n=1 Tax=Aggregatibacter segnis TaxID=739 RepID=UPI000D655363|nr:hypothetical protein [Aggregatibacter segnis]
MNNVFFESSKSYKPDSLDLKQIKINDYDELQKLATSYKGDNWALCLACLFKAKPFLYTKGSAPLLQQMTRLPIFLQQAGLFEESKYELQELFDNVDSHIEKCAESIGKNKELYKKYLKALYLNHLFDKARLIYKREGLNNLSIQFKSIASSYFEESKVLALELDKLRKLELAEFRRECEELDKLYPNAYEAADLVIEQSKNAKKVKLRGDMLKVFILFLVCYVIYEFF